MRQGNTKNQSIQIKKGDFQIVSKISIFYLILVKKFLQLQSNQQI